MGKNLKALCFAIVAVVIFSAIGEADSKYSYDPDLTNLQVYENLDLIDLKIIDLQIIPRDDTPNFLDESDLIKIKFQITKKDIGFFAISDKMFRIQVILPEIIKDGQVIRPAEKVDTYFTSYDDELEVRYKYLRPNFEIFSDCEYMKKRIFTNEPASYTMCFDVLRRWINEPLNLDGERKYFLYLMDNSQSNSCPNCKKILLSSNMTGTQLEQSSKNEPTEMYCKEGFEKIFRPQGSPACVKPSTAQVLLERGWTKNG